MNIAEWILVSLLSITLLIFLIIAIVALVKWNHLVDEAKKVIIKSQDIAETANDIAENVKGMTSVGNVVKTLSEKVNDILTPEDKKPKSKTTKNS